MVCPRWSSGGWPRPTYRRPRGPLGLGEARLREIPRRIAELMAALKARRALGRDAFHQAQAQALKAEQARLQAERPAAALR